MLQENNNKVVNADLEALKLLMLDTIYPVGSIYMSVNNVSPSTLFGGTWEAIKDRFLLAAGSTYTAGDTGGEATHSLTEAELPVIRSGTINWHGGEHGTHVYTIGDKWYGSKVNNMYQTTGQTNGAYSYQGIGFEFGGGAAHNNMPPYLTVYIWKRVS